MSVNFKEGKRREFIDTDLQVDTLDSSGSTKKSPSGWWWSHEYLQEMAHRVLEEIYFLTYTI